MTIQELITEILSELERLENSVETIVDQNDPLASLRWLPIGNGQTIRISKEIKELLSLVPVNL
jgi:hypothetical protein